jgi:F5/8 type C domain
MKTRAICLFLTSAALAGAAQVTFTSVVATYDQGAPYNVGASINGSALDGFGWGIFSNTAGTGQTAPEQSAVYTASSPFSGNRLAISIPQFLGGDHYSKMFRVSTTTDAAPSSGGTWTQITPSLIRAAHGLSIADQGLNRYSPIGVADAGTTNFAIFSDTPFANVTGIRLELFNLGGTIGAASNGNLVISEMLVTTDNSINLALGAAVTASAATWPGNPASFLTDGNINWFSHPENPPAQNGFAYTVDLNQSAALTSIELVNRTDGCCPERLSNYRVEVLSDAMTTLWSGNIRSDNSNSGTGGTDVVTAANGAGAFTGRYIRVTNLSGDAYNPQIAELRAFGAFVPEPGTTTLGLLSGLMVLTRRRR